MTRNTGTLDRRVRVFAVAPAAVLSGLLLGPASIGAIVLYALAVLMLATGPSGFCPLYALLRIDGRAVRPLRGSRA